MEQDLVILGLLMEKPRHGYAIKKAIQEELRTLYPFSSTSIYYTLSSLEKKGFLKKERGKLPNRPEKYIYHITQAGKKEFSNLLSKNLLEVKRPLLNLDISLYFLRFLEPQEAIKRLKNRLKFLKGAEKWLLEEVEKMPQEPSWAFSRQSILYHNLELVRADITFTERLIDEMKTCIEEALKGKKPPLAVAEN